MPRKTKALAVIPVRVEDQDAFFERVKLLVLDGLPSANSKRSYTQSLDQFFHWWRATPDAQQLGFCKASVQKFRDYLDNTLKKSPSTVNLRMCAVRKLAAEALDNAMIPHDIAFGIMHTKDIKRKGVRLGNWLTKKEAGELLRLPDRSEIKGKRDLAILGIAVGTGLRRSEMRSLQWEQIQKREGRWVFVDVLGKGNHLRSIPIPDWLKPILDLWGKELKGHQLELKGPVLRPFSKSGWKQDIVINHRSIGVETIRKVIEAYGLKMGKDALAPHDLRRTFSRLADKGGAQLRQIQLSLGHRSAKTTEVYLGDNQDMEDAPADKLGIDVEFEEEEDNESQNV